MLGQCKNGLNSNGYPAIYLSETLVYMKLKISNMKLHSISASYSFSYIYFFFLTIHHKKCEEKALESVDKSPRLYCIGEEVVPCIDEQ